MPSQSITDKLDELLQDDRNFSTRSGLRFMTELVRDAFNYIEEEKQRTQQTADKQQSFETRIGNIENGLNEFLKMRKTEQERNEAERSKWRWAIITPTLGVFIVEIARWVLTK